MTQPENHQIHLVLNIPRRKHIILTISTFMIVALVLLGATMAYSGKIKSEGDAEYAKHNYAVALLKYNEAKKWSLLDRISPKKQDSVLGAAKTNTEAVIKSSKDFTQGMDAFNKKQYPEAKRLLSLLTPDDEHYQEAKDTLKTIETINTAKLAEAPKPVNTSVVIVPVVKLVPKVDPLPVVIPKEESIPLAPVQNTLQESNNQVAKTYPILSLNELASNYDQLKDYANAIYDDFINTNNIQYLTPDQQKDLFQQKAESYFKQLADQKLASLKEEIKQLDTTPAPETPPAVYVNPDVEAALQSLRDKLNSTSNNPFLSATAKRGQISGAYRTWIGENQSVYSIISTTRYKTDLNTILAAYGL
ncbi:MAG: hypothetical protein NT141_04475 [candidate division WWE3 bacterium]|nr:hypothetical protein [candidate division WWE3 bacterium]